MKNWTGEYAVKGEYHKELNPFWPYLPVYLEKISIVRKLLDQVGSSHRILDAGSGEGILVSEYHQRGFNIIGMDLNYGSERVFKGNILNAPFANGVFDIILNLDVLEHMSFTEQERAISEFSRILRPGGYLIVSIPNLAHLASRLSFAITGKLIRTSFISRHPGDRPIEEFIQLLGKDFHIRQRKGIFPTFPLISFLTVWKPSKVIRLHRIYNRLLPIPGWCFLNVFLCEKK